MVSTSSSLRLPRSLAQLRGEHPDHRLRLGHERREVLIEELFGLLTGDVGVLLFVGEVALAGGRCLAHERGQRPVELLVVQLVEE
jgi:hypothetical protein